MGLDMYLEARRYIRDWRDEDKTLMEAVNAAIPDRGDMKVQAVTCEAAYWRKANAIHRWFVDNIQEGNDDCGTYYVNRERLAELRDTCKRVLENRALAVELLPTRSGFFFGDTSYSEYYWDDIDYTAEQLDKLLSEQYKDWEFSYHSSW